MPRSRSSRPSRPSSAPPVVRPSPPSAVQQTQPQGGMVRGLGGAIADGMAFGGGSLLARWAIDAVLGPRTIHHEMAQPSPPATSAQIQESDVCVNQTKAFKDCLNANGNDIMKCQFYADMLNECRKSSGVEAPQSSGQ